MEDTFNPAIDKQARHCHLLDVLFIAVDCVNLYLHFEDKLEKYFTEPVGAPDLPQFRVASSPGPTREGRGPGIHCLRMRGIFTECRETILFP